MSSLWQVLASAVGVQVLWVLVILFFVAVCIALSQFICHKQDCTTGFIKVRDFVGAAMREDLWRLSEHHPADECADYSLTLGLIESSGYANPLVVPGDYCTTHMYVEKSPAWRERGFCSVKSRLRWR